MAKRHNQKLLEATKHFREVASADEFYVCWWCGCRPENNSFDLDHICPLHINSPVAVACQKCNRGRKKTMPSQEQIDRLFHSEAVLSSHGTRELESFFDGLDVGLVVAGLE